ncbi:hypothetical protein J8273_8038 [Carpediemonas membranifera]|uniref:Reverse transcriptase domain-containing protein n=1 Tax=Carpediemonas membranifera TaxID=201153 RepID=A0A8J6DZF9_9EUKA|nr:hypothetical protein J8273_8038 [Carpediemonas membranifera]|eukprot:KAG9390668.1 hypothetical protein J8273_8038 [Carpediemonas membranifera]
MAKIDLSDGYHQLGVKPQDAPLLGVVLPNGQAYHYTGLSFGWTAAPYFFQLVMVQAARILALRFKVKVSVYLDDFLLAHADQAYLRSIGPEVLRTLQLLGIIVNVRKSELEPVQLIQYLGVLLDKRSMTISLPKDKAEKYRNTIRAALSSNKITAQDWASVIGRLGFFAYTSRLVHKLRRLQALRPSSELVLQPADRAELEQWEALLLSCPTRPFADLFPSCDLDLCVTSDASDEGWGAVIFNPGTSDSSIQGTFPANIATESINVRELYAVVRAVESLPSFKERRVLTVFTDNSTAQAWVNRQGLYARAPSCDGSCAGASHSARKPQPYHQGRVHAGSSQHPRRPAVSQHRGASDTDRAAPSSVGAGQHHLGGRRPEGLARSSSSGGEYSSDESSDESMSQGYSSDSTYVPSEDLDLVDIVTLC